MNPIYDKNWRAGAVLAVRLLLVVAPNRASGQPGTRAMESPTNIECLERLEAPDYPPLARSARVEATQIVKVLLSDQATTQTIESSLQINSRLLDLTKKEFTGSAEKALKNSRYSKTCGGKTITLVFHYEIRDDPNRSSLFGFGPPNHFWIRYGPVYAMPEGSGK